MVALLTTCFLAAIVIPSVAPSGRLIEPAMRSSLWRFDSRAAVNFNDHALDCGGPQVQHRLSRGQCGVCGDPYNSARDNQLGGRYDSGIIARRYRTGSDITMVADLLAAKGGFIEIKLCPRNDPTVPVTQGCFDQNPLQITNGDGRRLRVPAARKASNGLYRLDVRLPRGVACTHCVIQWRYHAADEWGYGANGKGCLGCGPQTEIYNCADVTIGYYGDSEAAPGQPADLAMGPMSEKITIYSEGTGVSSLIVNWDQDSAWASGSELTTSRRQGNNNGDTYYDYDYYDNDRRGLSHDQTSGGFANLMSASGGNNNMYDYDMGDDLGFDAMMKMMMGAFGGDDDDEGFGAQMNNVRMGNTGNGANRRSRNQQFGGGGGGGGSSGGSSEEGGGGRNARRNRNRNRNGSNRNNALVIPSLNQQYRRVNVGGGGSSSEEDSGEDRGNRGGFQNQASGGYDAEAAAAERQALLDKLTRLRDQIRTSGNRGGNGGNDGYGDNYNDNNNNGNGNDYYDNYDATDVPPYFQGQGGQGTSVTEPAPEPAGGNNGADGYTDEYPNAQGVGGSDYNDYNGGQGGAGGYGDELGNPSDVHESGLGLRVPHTHPPGLENENKEKEGLRSSKKRKRIGPFPWFMSLTGDYNYNFETNSPFPMGPWSGMDPSLMASQYGRGQVPYSHIAALLNTLNPSPMTEAPLTAHPTYYSNGNGPLLPWMPGATEVMAMGAQKSPIFSPHVANHYLSSFSSLSQSHPSLQCQRPDQLICVATPAYSGIPNADGICTSKCQTGGACGPEYCSCACQKTLMCVHHASPKGSASYGVTEKDMWCTNQCNSGLCPNQLCACNVLF